MFYGGDMIPYFLLVLLELRPENPCANILLCFPHNTTNHPASLASRKTDRVKRLNAKLSLSHYSCRSASIGLNLAAFLAG